MKVSVNIVAEADLFGWSKGFTIRVNVKVPAGLKLLVRSTSRTGIW